MSYGHHQKLGITVPVLHHLYASEEGHKRHCSKWAGSISDHPHFGRIQWNQSYSHMPQGHRARAADEPEMMSIEEPAAQPEPSAQPEAAVEPDKVDDEEEGEARRRSLSMHQIWQPSKIPWMICDLRLPIQREMHARHNLRQRKDLRHNNPCCEPSQTGYHQLQEHLHQQSDMSSTLIPLHYIFYFLYPHIVDIVNLKFGGMCAHFVFNYAIYFKLWFYFLL